MADSEAKYGIEDLAKLMGIEPASARVRLRAAGIKKTGKTYAWASKGEMEKVKAKCEAATGGERKSKKETKPAKKAAKPAKKVAKKSKSAGAEATA